MHGNTSERASPKPKTKVTSGEVGRGPGMDGGDGTKFIRKVLLLYKEIKLYKT